MGGEQVWEIREGQACTPDWWTISDREGGSALYRLRRNEWACCGWSTVSVTELSTNRVIGHIKKIADVGCCEYGARLVVTYPQELPLEHKLLLIVNMCTMKIRMDTAGSFT
jgi:hypothetical protein